VLTGDYPEHSVLHPKPTPPSRAELDLKAACPPRLERPSGRMADAMSAVGTSQPPSMQPARDLATLCRGLVAW
jgi:hypothetical protein